MILGVVDRVDSDERSTTVVKGGKLPRRQVAAHHRAIAAGCEPDHLQLDVVLVRPEPRIGGERALLAEQGSGRRLALLDSVLHRLQAQQIAVGETARRAIAGGDDCRIGGARTGVDDDAMLAFEAGLLRQFRVGQDADADQYQVGWKLAAVARVHGSDFALLAEQSADAGAQLDLDAVSDVQVAKEVRHHGRHRARHQARGSFQHDDCFAEFARHRREFEADEAAADHDHMARGR